MFGENIEPTLVLTYEGGAYTVPGAHVRAFTVDWTPWGFEADVEFAIEVRDTTGDTFLETFTADGLLEANLGVKVHKFGDGDAEPPAPLVAQGIVLEKRLSEQSFKDLSGDDVLVRIYGIRFVDPAAALWKQHFPCDLYVDQTLQDVLDAHKTDKVTMAGGNDWTILTTSRPQIFLGLGAPGNVASFYDWVIRRDALIEGPISSITSARETLETARLVAKKPEVEVRFARWPRTAFYPGAFVGFGTMFSSELYVNGKVFRVHSAHLAVRARQAQATTDHGMANARYDVELVGRLETADDAVIRRPAFVEPVYPVHVEGKIVSAQQQDTDETFDLARDDERSEDRYTVKVPSFANKLVKAPSRPAGLTGHFYFPAVRDARVLLGLGLHTAEIERWLEWRTAAALPPNDRQANHLVFGWTETNRTLLTHQYEDQKPVLSLQRILEKDTETLEMKEGMIVIETKENS